MCEKYLSSKQSICAMRIFLNMFGLTLEKVDNVDNDSVLKIIDKSNNEVGSLYSKGNEIIASALYNGNSINASYTIPKIFAFYDSEDNNALSGHWNNNIIYNCNNNGIGMDGEFTLECYIDSVYGINCRVHSLMNIENLNKEKITLSIFRGGQLFGLKKVSDNYIEKIKIMPWDDLDGYIYHDIKSGEYNSKTATYTYQKTSGVFCGGKEDKDKYHLYMREDKDNNNLNIFSEIVTKKYDDESMESLVEKGNLMREIDPSILKVIESVKNLIVFDDEKVIENLFSISYDKYSDESIEALLGVKRKKMNYQDGHETLIDSYFGIGDSELFLPKEKKMKLIK